MQMGKPSGSVVEDVRRIGRAARVAARQVAGLDAAARTAILHAMAVGIESAAKEIESANTQDIEDGREVGLADAMIDRLLVTPARLAEMAAGLRQIASLPDLLGAELKRIEGPGGLDIRKVRVPLGVIGMIYESRPNVTADAAGLCLKAGNAVILRGGSEAIRSNRAILDAMVEAGSAAGLPQDAIQLIDTPDRAAVYALLEMDDCIDLIIPRGGEGLINAVVERSRIPVLKHAKGVCHVYVDRAADLDMAHRIVINAKCQRPGVCNAMETLLVHESVADRFVPTAAAALLERGVELRGDSCVCELVPQARPATEADWTAEYLDLILAVRIVPDLSAAIDHIESHGSRHSDVIVTNDQAAADRFLREVDSAAVYHNASSRFTDGGQFGMGAEIGISTDKIGARGPMGLEELTSYKWLGIGNGQVRI